ncbi:Mu transposase C-terminal domain-containing protein [Rhodopseudomonas telluris]|uniref:Mu transposase C-terminal domain-containing protein n=1 Tax=Rhodopseudomonas telluris TaxID=644215 RepID=A0ABV6EYF2_9BRAD
MNTLPAQQAASLSPPAVPRFRFDPTDKVTIKGVDYVPTSADQFGHVFRRVDDPAVCESFTHGEIDELRKEDGWVHCRGFFSSSKARLRIAKSTTFVSDLPSAQIKTVLFQKTFCDRFLQMAADGLATRSDVSMQRAVDNILNELISSQLSDGRCGSEDLTVTRPPSPRTLRRWLSAYAACAWDTMALAQNYGRSGNRFPRFGKDERELMQEYAELYASRLQPSKRSLLSDLHGKIVELNKTRKVTGERLLKFPSRAAFERVISRLDPFHVYAGRKGPEAARKKFFIVQSGLSVTRPLERIELDENRIPLQTLLTDARLWDRLTDKQKALVERRRLWLSTAIDTATRCCLAALIIENPSEASAIATLEMAVNDKSAYASAAGCVSPWDEGGTPEGIGNDAGAGYKAYGYRAAGCDLGADMMFPTTGTPQMRGRQERFYRTVHTGFFAKFDGRTFENVLAKGDYDSEANAVLDASELGRLLVRWIVDVYHNTPHSGLGGETPRNAWLRLTKIFPVIPPPDKEVNRHIFGITRESRIGNHGVRFLGLHYQSQELQRLRRKTGMKPVLVRIDRNDLGRISVRPKPSLNDTSDQGWISVDCLAPGFKGVSVEHWMRAASVIRRKHADMAKVSEGVVQQALRDIAEFSQAAAKRAGIAPRLLTSDDFNKFDRDVARNFEFARGSENAPAVLEVSAESNVVEGAAEQPVQSPEIPDEDGDEAWFVED